MKLIGFCIKVFNEYLVFLQIFSFIANDNLKDVICVMELKIFAFKSL